MAGNEASRSPLQNQYADHETGCITTFSGITSLMRTIYQSGLDWVGRRL